MKKTIVPPLSLDNSFDLVQGGRKETLSGDKQRRLSHTAQAVEDGGWG